MPVLAPDQVDEVAIGWRRGVDPDGLPSPAGPLFDGYAESEITMTGGNPTEKPTDHTCSVFAAIDTCCWL